MFVYTVEEYGGGRMIGCGEKGDWGLGVCVW